MNYKKTNEIHELMLSRMSIPASKEEKMAHNASEQMACVRSRFYSWTEPEQPEEPSDEWFKKQWIFNLGSAVEHILGNYLMMTGLLPAPSRTQVRVRSRKYLISGAIDFLIQIDGKDIPIECKSTKHMAFTSTSGYYCTNCGEKLWKSAKACKGCQAQRPELEFRTTKEGYSDKPSEEHYAQLQSYLWVNDYEYGYLFYLDKDSAEMSWFKIYPDEEVWKAILEQNVRLMQFVESKTLPPRPFEAKFDINGDMKDSSDWHCRYCRWSRVCYGDVLADLERQRAGQIKSLFGGIQNGPQKTETGQ